MGSAFGGCKLHVLETKTFARGGVANISMQDLPPGRRIRGIMVSMLAEITQGGSAAAIDGDELQRYFASIVIGKYHRSTGRGLKILNWLMTGRDPALPASVAATNSGVFQRVIQVWIPYADLRAANPDDCSPNTEFFRDTPIELTFGDPLALHTSLASVTGTVRAVVYHEPADPGVVPSVVEIGYADHSSQTFVLPPGTYTHIFLYNEDGAGYTSAEVIDVSLKADGESILERIQLRELLAGYNQFSAQGASRQALSTTAEVEGEALTDEPARAAAAATTITTEAVPMVFQGDKYKLSKCIHSLQGLRVDLTGSDTSHRVAWRRLIQRGPDQMNRAAARIGVPNAHNRVPKAKTLSKVETFSGYLRSIFPAKYY